LHDESSKTSARELAAAPRLSAILGQHEKSSLRGHVALITGANDGIGAATAMALAAFGEVVVTYLRISDPGDRAVRNFTARLGRKAQKRDWPRLSKSGAEPFPSRLTSLMHGPQPTYSTARKLHQPTDRIDEFVSCFPGRVADTCSSVS
jgi:NAD(P)-dependent dehydrogenase (short-subunit alcohol dehydrogenase family)